MATLCVLDFRHVVRNHLGVSYLNGHKPVMGGRPYDSHHRPIRGGGRHTEGRILCECGWASPMLRNDIDRRAAHDRHKDEIRGQLPSIGAGLVGRCWWCHEAFITEESMTAHYDAIRAGRGCHLPEVRMP